MNSLSSAADILFYIVPAIIFVSFIVIIAMFFRVIGKGVKEWSHNNSLPIRVAAAQIVAKRTEVSSSTQSDADNNSMINTSTYYYITFELEDGQRMEFGVGGQAYGLLVEKDRGKLKFQGTRYHGFERAG